MRRVLLLMVALLVPALAQEPPANAWTIHDPIPRGQRLKDIARPAGLNNHSLTGYGLVVGLPGTGDSSMSLSSPMMTNMLKRLGLDAGPGAVTGLKSKNVAVVAVTAALPAVVRSGDPIQVEVASMGDAKDLTGGVLLQSLLTGPDGQVYGAAQGKVSGGSDPGKKGPVTGRIEMGGTVSRELTSPALSRPRLILELHKPDYSTAQKVADAISLRLSVAARPLSDSMVEVNLEGTGLTVVGALAQLEDITVEPDRRATIVVDRRSGVVVVGSTSHIRQALINHKGITVDIGPQGVPLKSVLDSLSKAGAGPDDVVAVLEALHQAGALPGEIEYR